MDIYAKLQTLVEGSPVGQHPRLMKGIFVADISGCVDVCVQMLGQVPGVNGAPPPTVQPLSKGN